jgi:hypothetical protein
LRGVGSPNQTGDADSHHLTPREMLATVHVLSASSDAETKSDGGDELAAIVEQLDGLTSSQLVQLANDALMRSATKKIKE